MGAAAVHAVSRALEPRGSAPSRAAARPEPRAARRCDLPCPSNILSTVTDLVFAIFNDVTQAVRLAVARLGSGLQKCVCAVAGMLEPHWRKVATDPLERCEGDPMEMIMGKILSEAVKIPEGIVNNAAHQAAPGHTARLRRARQVEAL